MEGSIFATTTVQQLLDARPEPVAPLVTVKSSGARFRLAWRRPLLSSPAALDGFYEALWRLYKGRVSSAPVVPASGSVAHTISVADLVVFAALSFEDHKLVSMTQREFWESQFDLTREHGVQAMAEMILKPAQRIAPSATLEELLRVLRVPGQHSVCVAANTSADITAMVSQSDVIRFVRYKGAALPAAFRNAVVGDWALRALLTTTPSEPVVKALERLVDNTLGFTAMPVVDPETRVLVDTLSLSDFRAIDPALLFRSLDLSVSAFLKSLGERSQRPAHGKSVTAHAGESLLACCERMLHHGVHRVWIVDAHHVPVGSVSLGDVLAQ